MLSSLHCAGITSVHRTLFIPFDVSMKLNKMNCCKLYDSCCRKNYLICSFTIISKKVYISPPYAVVELKLIYCEYI